MGVLLVHMEDINEIYSINPSLTTGSARIL